MKADATAVDLARSLTNLGDQMRQDLEAGESRPVYAEIREVRQVLDAIEETLRPESSTTVGDAC